MDSVRVEQVHWDGEIESEYPITSDYRVFCPNPGCNCYPFICFICKVCQERWWTHCGQGVPPRGVCGHCYDLEREITREVLRKGEKDGTIPLESRLWWEIFAKGIRPEYYCYHSNEPIPFAAQIIKAVCRKTVPGVWCCSPYIKDRNWESYKQRQRPKEPPEEYPCC